MADFVKDRLTLFRNKVNERQLLPSDNPDAFLDAEDANDIRDAVYNLRDHTLDVLQQLTDLTADNILTPSEKGVVIRDVAEILAEQAGLDAQATNFSITTEKTTYDAAVVALNTYIGTLSAPTWWNDLSGNTNISGAQFRQMFTAVYIAREALQLRIFAATKDMVTGILTQLQDITRDDVLRPNEKVTVKADYNAILAEAISLTAQADNFGVINEKVGYDNSIVALTNYLASLTTPKHWDDETGDTDIDGDTFYSTFTAVYVARTALISALLAAARQSIRDINGQLNSIISDNILSPGEKPSAIADYQEILDEQPHLDDEANAYLTSDPTVGDAKDAYDQAIAALTNHLNTLMSPRPWNDKSGDTNLVPDGDTFRQKFLDVYNRRAALVTKIMQVADANVSLVLDQIGDVVKDNIITPSEKIGIKADYQAIVDERPALLAEAVEYGIVGEKNIYNTAVDNLTNYLATVNNPVLWNDTSANTIIGADGSDAGSIFKQQFANVYSARTILLAKILSVSKQNVDGIRNTKTTVFHTNAAPTNPINGYTLVLGDQWFNTDTTTPCPYANCRGHTVDANQVPLVGSYPHRAIYWPHFWNGSAWIDENRQALLVASELAVGSVGADQVQANAIYGRHIKGEEVTLDHLNFVPVETDKVIASINASVEQSGQSVLKITADKITFDGAAIFKAINGDNNTTTIDGGKIKTDSMDIRVIHGVSPDGKLPASAVTIDTSVIFSDPQFTDKVNKGDLIDGVTEISGANIKTGTIDAARIHAIDVTADNLKVGGTSFNDIFAGANLVRYGYVNNNPAGNGSYINGAAQLYGYQYDAIPDAFSGPEQDLDGSGRCYGSVVRRIFLGSRYNFFKIRVAGVTDHSINYRLIMTPYVASTGTWNCFPIHSRWDTDGALVSIIDGSGAFRNVTDLGLNIAFNFIIVGFKP